MNCKNCRWWNDTGVGREDWAEGQCKRHSPMMPLQITLGTHYGREPGRWPVTRGDDGCGDFERLVTTAETGK